MDQLEVVTGAFGFTGRHIADRLLSMGKSVLTLTGHSERREGQDERIAIAPFNFDKPGQLVESLKGASVIYNTYWVRFSSGFTTFDKAIRNSKILIDAAKEAGVRRLVHVSITNPSPDSPLAYFRGKAIVEQAIKDSGLSYAILRPAVIFGEQGILINNIAWFLRRFPFFAVPGDGEYKIQPTYVEDLADLAVKYGHSDENIVLDAVGPEIYTFNELVRLIADAVHSRARIKHVNPELAFFLTTVLDSMVHDIVLTREEIKGLMANLLVSSDPPTCPTRLSDWLRENADWLGREYMSELKKHYR